MPLRRNDISYRAMVSQSPIKRPLADHGDMARNDAKSMVLFLLLFLAVILLHGCGFGRYDKRTYYSPQPAEGWSSVGGRFYQFKCNQERVRVSPIVLEVREWADAYLGIPVPKGEQKEVKMAGRDKPWTIVEFYRTPRNGSCELEYFWLISLSTGDRIPPSSAETRKYTDPSSLREFVSCIYLYDIKKDSNTTYRLYLSDDTLGCKAEPITYIFEEATRYWSGFTP
jgi:hypothetical protein